MLRKMNQKKRVNWSYRFVLTAFTLLAISFTYSLQVRLAVSIIPRHLKLVKRILYLRPTNQNAFNDRLFHLFRQGYAI